MKPVTSEYKASTIAYKMPFADFPKDCWVTFRIHIDRPPTARKPKPS